MHVVFYFRRKTLKNCVREEVVSHLESRRLAESVDKKVVLNHVVASPKNRSGVPGYQFF